MHPEMEVAFLTHRSEPLRRVARRRSENGLVSSERHHRVLTMILSLAARGTRGLADRFDAAAGSLAGGRAPGPQPNATSC